MNFRIQWSEYLTINNKAENDWLRSVLQFDVGELQDVISYLKQFGVNINEEDINLNCFPGFTLVFDTREIISDEKSRDQGVIIYNDESSELEVITSIIQAFLRKFRPNDFFKIEWSDSSLKPNGEFSGGVVFITADKTETMTTGNWLSEKIKAFKSQQ